MRFIILSYLAITLFVLPDQIYAMDEAVPTKPSQFRTTFEEVTLPGDEIMGFQGFTLLYEVNDFIAIGPAAYGALTGNRGGAITLGLATDFGSELTESLSWNAGVFVGGGGGVGGYTLHGGGLHVRTHLGMDAHLGNWGDVGAGVSYQDFPTGTVHSFQPYLSYTYNFDTLMVSGWNQEVGEQTAVTESDASLSEFTVIYRTYEVPDGVLRDDLKPQFPTVNILGAEWRRFISEHVYLKVESEGAMGGQSKGYMQILFGGGYGFDVTQSTRINASASMGVAGGGHISTAGGLLMDANISVQQNLFDGLFLELGRGYVVAPDGDFKAASLNMYLGYQYEMPDVQGRSINKSALAGFEPRHMRLRYVYQQYLKNDPKWRNHHADLDVGLLGFKCDYFLADNFYLSGHGVAAVEGQGGNFMIGLIGGGLHQSWGDSPIFADLEFLVGAAGGGGLDVGGGLAWQGNIELGYQLSETNQIALSYGEMEATGGNFKAHVVGLSVSYNLSFFVR